MVISQIFIDQSLILFEFSLSNCDQAIPFLFFDCGSRGIQISVNASLIVLVISQKSDDRLN